MRQEIKFTYIEQYLPTPRSKKMREREAKGTVTVTIHHMFSQDVHKVMRVRDFENDMMDIVSYNGKLYRNLQGRNFKLNKDVNVTAEEMDWQMLLWGHERMSRVENRPQTKEGAIDLIKKEASKFIIVGDYVYERTPEPIYKIVSFGLLHSAGMFIDWAWKENRNSFCTYSALERKECHADLKEHLSHCTMKYDNSERVMIEVIDKNFVRFKRNKAYLRKKSFVGNI